MITIKVSKDTLNEIESTYSAFIVERNVGYILFAIKTENEIITAYDNKKQTYFKVTIQGENEVEIAKKYSLEPLIASLDKKHKVSKVAPEFVDVNQQIGSDEVGTGDFFGPIVVCSAYVDFETMKVIEECGIIDSKKLTDTKILEIVPLVLKKVHYSCKVVSNTTYNDLIDKGSNMNQIKCLAHNHCLVKLHERCPYVKNVYVDQFTSEEHYYNYLNGVTKVERGIIFREKGESYFPSVALASCIARYYFLLEMDKISKFYKMKLPLGASNEVDKFAKDFLRRYGKDELDKIVKKNFKNYKALFAEQLTLL